MDKKLLAIRELNRQNISLFIILGIIKIIAIVYAFICIFVIQECNLQSIIAKLSGIDLGLIVVGGIQLYRMCKYEKDYSKCK